MIVDMANQDHLCVQLNPRQGDRREVIIDRRIDVRIADGRHIVKVMFSRAGGQQTIQRVLVDDIDVWMDFG